MTSRPNISAVFPDTSRVAPSKAPPEIEEIHGREHRKRGNAFRNASSSARQVGRSFARELAHRGSSSRGPSPASSARTPKAASKRRETRLHRRRRSASAPSPRRGGTARRGRGPFARLPVFPELGHQVGRRASRAGGAPHRRRRGAPARGLTPSITGRHRQSSPDRVPRPPPGESGAAFRLGGASCDHPAPAGESSTPRPDASRREPDRRLFVESTWKNVTAAAYVPAGVGCRPSGE